MRQALATLLMVVFSLPLIAPAFAAGPDDSALPACCRRNGQHHCAMRGMMVETPPRYVVLSAKCPFAPFGNVALMVPHVFNANRRPPAAVPLAGPAAILREAEAGYRVSFHRARQKRGPPLLLAL